MYEREVTLQTDIRVILHDPEKTEDYFIDGDWKNYFFTFSDLDDLIEHLAYAARYMGTEWKHNPEKSAYDTVIDIEGFPYFHMSSDKRNSYVAENIIDETNGNRETGKIEIIWDEEYYVF